MLWWTAAALAAGPDLALTASTTVVSGPVNAAADTVEVDPGNTWNPRLSVGLTGQLFQPLGERFLASATWGVRRDQALCDTCDEDGFTPRNGGGLQALDSQDLSLAVSSLRLVEAGPVGLTGSVGAVLPASRDAFVCNPFYGAATASLGLRAASEGAAAGLTGSVRRDLYRFDAAPVGRPACTRGLVGQTTIGVLTGAATPQAWEATRFGAPNPAWSSAMRAGLLNPHRWLGGPQWLTTTLSAGLGAVRRRTHDATTVETLTGAVQVDASHTPWVSHVPLSAGVGVMGEHLSLQLTARNSLPGLLADPGATLSALPATTATTLAATGRW